MFVIRKEQMKVLSEYIAKAFHDRMARHLRKVFPDKTAKLSDAELRKVIEDAIPLAENYGVVKEDDVEKFLEYTMRFGKNFAEQPSYAWAGSILRPNDVDGSRKMRRIANRIQKIDGGLE